MSVRLRRLRPGVYGLNRRGEDLQVVRETDGTLGSAVIWSVRRAPYIQACEVAHFTTLAEVRAWADA